MPISAGTNSLNRGFTLLEVLLVLSIIGLAGVLLVPRLGSLDSRGFAVEVRQAANLLNHARRNAVVTGNPASVSFLPEPADDESDTGRRFSAPACSARKTLNWNSATAQAARKLCLSR